MRRKKRFKEEAENRDRWLVSYADFITILFGFFVIMYSISSVNEGKYRILSNALDEAFSKHDTVEQAEQPIELGNKATAIQPIPLEHLMTTEKQKEEQLSVEIKEERRRLARVAEQFKEQLEPYVNQDLVDIKRDDFWLELEMKSSLLFRSGEAELSVKAMPLITKIAEIIKQTHNVIHVEGHTDTIPIDTVEFPSNWDLSSARASSVVKELAKNGIESKRMAALGYGEFHPIADNTTEEGRFKNRRVVLVLLSQSIARYKTENQQSSQLSASEAAADLQGNQS